MLDRLYRWGVLMWRDLPPLGEAPVAYLFLGLGLLLLMAAILNWKRLAEPKDLPRRAVVRRFVYLRFGNRGYRIYLALLGLASMYLGFWLMIVLYIDAP